MAEQRYKRDFDSIRLPIEFEDEDRGLSNECCEPYIVFGGGDQDWKNDINSAWIKLSGSSDTVTFELTNNDNPTSYTLNVEEFINEPFAFYVTIPWDEVLSSDGIGCYKLSITYNISGVEATIVWGIYELQVFSFFRARNMARVQAVFNQKQSIEGIDFSQSKVVDTLRFYGFIGNKQPNTEIDNLIYADRVVRSVTRENLNEYEINTDPLKENYISKLTDLFLLSETELLITDYNSHNHTYRILDTPVIVESSPEITYPQYSRFAILTCVVGDKTKNDRTFY